MTEKKTVIITGASSGLGREYLQQLLTDSSIEEYWIIARRKELLERIALQDKRIIAYPMDITCEEDIHSFIQFLDQKKPDITLLINSAGMGKASAVKYQSASDTSSMIDLNCKALAIMTQICLPFMQRGSHIVEIASVAGFQPMPGFAIYGACKAFVLSYARALGKELRPEGIHVTAVCPYWVKDTEFIANARKDPHSGYRNRWFSSRSADIVRKSLTDIRKNRPVSTPDPVSSIDRAASTILPDSLLVSIMNIIQKL